MNAKLILTAIVATTLSCAHAKLIAYEPFDYEDGNGETLFGTTTGYGWSGEWFGGQSATDTTGSPSFTRRNAYTNGIVQYDFNYTDTNGLSVLTHGNVYARFTDARQQGSVWEGITTTRYFAETNTLATGESLWMSFLGFHETGATKVNYVLLYLLSPNRANTSWAIAGGAESDSTYTFKWGVRYLSGKNPAYSYATNIVAATPMFVLMQLTMTSATKATVNLWVNPPDISSEGALGIPDVARTSLDVTPQFYGFQISAHKQKPVSFDELRIGTTLRDVVTGDIPPEATLLIIR